MSAMLWPERELVLRRVFGDERIEAAGRARVALLARDVRAVMVERGDGDEGDALTYEGAARELRRRIGGAESLSGYLDRERVRLDWDARRGAHVDALGRAWYGFTVVDGGLRIVCDLCGCECSDGWYLDRDRHDPTACDACVIVDGEVRS